MKNKRDANPTPAATPAVTLTVTTTSITTTPVTTTPTTTAATPPSLDVNAHLGKIRSGDLQSAYDTLTAIRDNTVSLTKPEQTAALRSWIEGVFNDPSALAHTDQPMLYIDLIRAARRLSTDDPTHLPDKWLLDLLDNIPNGRVVAFAEDLIFTTWHTPDILNGPLCDWLRGRVDISLLNQAQGGISCLLLSLLWNTYQYDAICALIADGIDTAQPSYYGMGTTPPYEGLHSGRVQPLEHVLGKYLRLASLPSLAPQGTDLDLELAALGADSPGGNALDKPKQRERGVKKVEGAQLVLKALATKGSAKILTSYQAVQASPLLVEFAKKPGTIWGFEHVRLPYVQAAHATPEGNQPVRMWELWQVVQLALWQGDYESLLTDPDTTIPHLVSKGVTAMKTLYTQRPADYLWWSLKDFQTAFERQCTAFLRSYAEQPPRAKFPTAALRGYDIGAYLGALGCIAGLWWAENVGGHVYYCLDGVKEEDVTGYKQFRISYINTFLDTAGPYVECITLAEIRHILKNWTALRGTVTFTRMGQLVPANEIDALAKRLEVAEGAVTEKRKAPSDMAPFETIVKKLDPTLATLGTYDLMRVAAQVYLLETAASAKSDKVLLRYLETKGCRVLFDKGILPAGFADSYRKLIDEKDPATKKSLGTDLIAFLRDDAVSGQPRVCDYLRKPLVAAISRHSGATA